MLVTVCLGLLLGIVFSHELWFPVSRTFPRSPLIAALPVGVAVALDWLFSSILCISLLLSCFFRSPNTFLMMAVFAVLVLTVFDQMHLQPWVYQYVLILVVFARHDRGGSRSADDRTLGLAQIVIAGIYIWSGIQKMNFNFSHDVLPFLLGPVQTVWPSIGSYYLPLGVAVSLLEFLVGVGLLFRKTRTVAVCMAVFMHLLILSLLIAKNYNSIVWFWNLTLIFAVVFAFWRTDNSPVDALAAEKYSVRKLIVCAALLLPVLNFFGWWDSFLSGAYYSGNVKIPAIRINDEVFEKLPETARSAVFKTGTTGEKILPPFEWSIADTNAPVYLEERVFRQVTQEICKLATDKDQVEMIIRNRPAIMDGSYTVTRVTCAELMPH